MGATCSVCGKHPQFGRSIKRLGSNAQKRRILGTSNRRFNPNIQRIRVVVGGTTRRADVCTSCIKAGKVTKPRPARAAATTSS